MCAAGAEPLGQVARDCVVEICLEVELFQAGYHVEMCEALEELTDNGVARTRAGEWSANPESLDTVTFLKDITAIGKGRFAQRLASRIDQECCPDYIKEAIEYVAKRC